MKYCGKGRDWCACNPPQGFLKRGLNPLIFKNSVDWFNLNFVLKHLSFFSLDPLLTILSLLYYLQRHQQLN